MKSTTVVRAEGVWLGDCAKCSWFVTSTSRKWTENQARDHELVHSAGQADSVLKEEAE